jgi:hypothetical protein
MGEYRDDELDAVHRFLTRTAKVVGDDPPFAA